jgi:adenylate cyclase
VAKKRTTRKLGAILSADMVGYSRLMGADEEGTIARQKAHRNELIDPTIAMHHGRIVKTTGDGMLVEFTSAVDAVKCAAEIQRGMAKREAKAADNKHIAYRIGINAGDIVIDGDNIVGDGVNITTRLEPLAEPRDICISRNVFDRVKQKLDFEYEGLSEQKLKNIAKRLQAFHVWSKHAHTKPDIEIRSDKVNRSDNNQSPVKRTQYFSAGIVSWRAS